MNKPRVIPANTVFKFAVTSGAVGSIEYIEGLPKQPMPLPHEGDVLTLPFMVHPTTRQPTPVVVLQIVEMLHLTPPTIAVVVGRPQ
jgi:hypothetical protein